MAKEFPRLGLLALMAVALPLAGLAALLYAGWRWVSPRRGPAPRLRETDLEDVWFESLDGVRLHGLWLEGRPDHPTIVMCHGYFKSCAEPLEAGLALHRRGYNVFVIDFRACGRSGGRFTTVGAKETLDVLAAVRLAKRRWGRLPIGVLGISMGGAAAIMAAARSTDIAALVADSAYADIEGVIRHKIPDFVPFPWLVPLGGVAVSIGELLAGSRIRDVRPIDFVDKISPRPVLFIYGECDSFVPWPQPQELFERAGDPKEIWFAPGSDHAVAKDDYPEEYQRRVESFFERYLLEKKAMKPASPRKARPEPSRRARR
ncbi:MAG: alpha/beta hydrolase [Chloroflexi bacterium]|nr:alpha/beta hydrolase [Chloroflexota bacterium]